MDFTNIQTDAQGEYVADQFGSKHRRQSENSWTLVEADMTQAHKDFRAAEQTAAAASLQALKDDAIAAFGRIKTKLNFSTNAQCKQFLRDTHDVMQYLDEIGA